MRDASSGLASATRDRISSAARFENVSARIAVGGTPWSRRDMIRPTRVRVLPVPGPASKSNGPRGAWAASCWLGSIGRSFVSPGDTSAGEISGVSSARAICCRTSPSGSPSLSLMSLALTLSASYQPRRTSVGSKNSRAKTFASRSLSSSGPYPSTRFTPTGKGSSMASGSRLNSGWFSRSGCNHRWAYS